MTDTTSKSFDVDRARRITYRYIPRYKRVIGEQPIAHRYKKVINRFDVMVKEGEMENAFMDSDLNELSITTVHNYDEKSLFEQNMDFLGISDYVVLKHSGDWHMFMKYEHLLRFIDSGKCKPYLLFCDARDTIFMDDPAKIIPLFKSFECEMVFNATMSPRGVFKSYSWAMPLYWWYRKISRTGWMKKYPNAGVFVGKTSFMVEVFENILRYASPKSIYQQDQDVVRCIFPWYFPRMKIDYYNRIVYRN